MPLYEKAHVGHENHLCKRLDNGLSTIDEYKELVRNPKFLCQYCGRVAARLENLCAPVPL